MRCDLHVHSKYSGAVNLPLLRHVGRECYAEPVDVYWTALRRSMDLVTITDHDTIDGALRIAHLPNVFVSEEVTCHLPAGRVIHLGVLDIDEAQHAGIAARRSDAQALFAFLAEQRLPFAVNHPFSPMTGVREPEDLHEGFRHAPLVEALNGMMPARSNEFARESAGELGLATIGGSDAHALGSIARAFTTIPKARTKQEFLSGLRRGLTVPVGSSGSYSRLVADIGAIFCSGLIENAVEAGKGWAPAGRFAAMLVLIPVLGLLPLIALANFARESLGASAIDRRFRASTGHRFPASALPGGA